MDPDAATRLGPLVFEHFFTAGPPTLATALRMRRVCRAWKEEVDANRPFWLGVCRSMQRAIAQGECRQPPRPASARELMCSALVGLPESRSRCIECAAPTRSRVRLLSDRPATLCTACQGSARGFRSLVTRRQVSAICEAACGGYRVRWRTMKGQLRLARYSRKGAHFYWRAQVDGVLLHAWRGHRAPPPASPPALPPASKTPRTQHRAR